MKVQCTTQAWVFVHVHVEYIKKYRQGCIDIGKKPLDASLQSTSIVQQAIVL